MENNGAYPTRALYGAKTLIQIEQTDTYVADIKHLITELLLHGHLHMFFLFK